MEIPFSKKYKQHLVADLIESFGYPVEIHDGVRSKDDYLTVIYRIPHGKANSNTIPKPPVILMHGILCNSMDYVITGPERGLGFILSDLGYDVWMPNHRGTKISCKHSSLDPDKDEQYWKFSTHELGYYDLPAILNHVADITGFRSLSYIGYSLGALLPLILASEKPEYNERFNLVILIAPPATLRNIRSKFPRVGLSLSCVWLPILKKLGILEFPPKWMYSFKSYLYGWLATNSWYNLAYLYLYSINGTSSQHLLKRDILSIWNYYPETTSAFIMEHLHQLHSADMFRKLDYGCQQNLDKYGTPEAPAYDLSKVTCPVAIISSTGDLITHYKEIRELSRQLPNCIAYHEIESPIYGHVDFVYATDAAKVVYTFIFDHLKEQHGSKNCI